MLQRRSLSSSSIGNAGEHLVIAQLLMRGFHAGLADRGNAAFDVFTRDGDHQCGLRVKTCTHGDARVTWSAKRNGEIFLEMGENDFVVIVRIPDFDIAQARYWVMPTREIDAILKATHKQWLSLAKRDGGARKDTALRGLYLKGAPSYNRGFEQAWGAYESAWDQLAGRKRQQSL